MKAISRPCTPARCRDRGRNLPGTHLRQRVRKRARAFGPDFRGEQLFQVFQHDRWRLGWLVVPRTACAKSRPLPRTRSSAVDSGAVCGLAAFSPAATEILEARRANSRGGAIFCCRRCANSVLDTADPEGAFYIYAGIERFAADSGSLPWTCWRMPAWQSRRERISVPTRPSAMCACVHARHGRFQEGASRCAGFCAASPAGLGARLGWARLSVCCMRSFSAMTFCGTVGRRRESARRRAAIGHQTPPRRMASLRMRVPTRSWSWDRTPTPRRRVPPVCPGGIWDHLHQTLPP